MQLGILVIIALGFCIGNPEKEETFRAMGLFEPTQFAKKCCTHFGDILDTLEGNNQDLVYLNQ